ncbi:hypothetical protein LCGC14_3045610 [marine sediment metagenome]|uniref:Uncharacterized protein n=1 Tax=marine sediment metagenome TaxID=412755 RepID=A0A0F8ZE63_9ZZZZ
MAKIIEDPNKVNVVARARCRNCLVLAEYEPSDIRTVYDRETPDIMWKVVFCPRCKDEIRCNELAWGRSA